MPLCVAVCSAVPLCVAVCSAVPLCVAVCSAVPLCVAVCSAVPLCVAVCSAVPLCVALCTAVSPLFTAGERASRSYFHSLVSPWSALQIFFLAQQNSFALYVILHSQTAESCSLPLVCQDFHVHPAVHFIQSLLFKCAFQFTRHCVWRTFCAKYAKNFYFACMPTVLASVLYWRPEVPPQ